MIVFVCRGNIARSPAAEVILKRELRRRGIDKKFVVLSRGLQGTFVDPKPVQHPNITFYHPLYEYSKPALKKLKIDIENHVSKPINRTVAEEAGILIGFDRKNRDVLLVLFPEMKNKIHLLSEFTGGKEDFPDPAGVDGEEKHFEIYKGIERAIKKGFSRLIGSTGGVN